MRKENNLLEITCTVKARLEAMEPGSDVKAKLLGYFAKYTKHYRELYKSQGKAKMAKSRSIQKARGKV